jgi:hypothetical protein
MNAAMIPINGICLSPSALFVFEIARPMMEAEVIQQITETTKLRKPSGMCMRTGE